MGGDADYFARREQEERRRAEESADAKVREVHLILAAKYAQLAQRESELEAGAAPTAS